MVRSAGRTPVGTHPGTGRSTAPGPRRGLIARALLIARAFLIVGAAGAFMGDAAAPLASAGVRQGVSADAPSISWDSAKALAIDATPGASVSATLLNNTAAALDVTLQVDAPDAIAVMPERLDIPAGGSRTVKVGLGNAPAGAPVAGSYTVTAVTGPRPAR